LRYQQTRERSAELLRLVVPQMYRNPAGLHPEHYAIWYEHLAGINGQLSAAIEARVSSGATLSDQDVESLYRSHIAARDESASERMQHELALLVEKVGEMAAGAGEGMAQYSDALATCAQRLRSGLSPETLHEVVEVLTARTDAVRGQTSQLCEDLGRFRAEAETLRSQVERLREEALTDALTGLANRRGLERFVAQISASAEGLSGTSCLVCDVDHFKKLNDSYGHLLGDRVLAGIGRVLKARVKGRDVVARWGGEEFAVLLPQTAAKDALTVAEQIRDDIRRGRIKRVDRDEYIGKVTISIGIAECAGRESFASVMERADAALYEAKAAGRDRAVISRHAAGVQTRRSAGGS
jgi:diguanylate cyclase